MQVAAVFEFVGAVALGASVVATIAGNIARPTSFAASPGTLARNEGRA